MQRIATPRWPPDLAAHTAPSGITQGDHYEVLEQNFLDFNPDLEGHRAAFDLRSVAWPAPAVVGFVVAPRVG